jgi:hypothetical protein
MADPTVVRLIVSTVLGIAAAAAIILSFTNQSLLPMPISVFVPLAILIVVQVFSTIINMGVSSVSCGLNMKKSILGSFIPTVIAGIIVLMFFLLEPLVGMFSFPFNTIGLASGSLGSYKSASVFGLAFALFWFVMYGQIFSSGYVEMCE